VKLERLNLSFNQLQGKVPPSLGRLSSLHRLNLSYNHLQGQIPSTFSGFPLSSFMGNNHNLCGPPLLSCSELKEHERIWELSKASVVGITVAIVLTATVICMVLLYIMLRIWCNWRKVTISCSENGGIESKSRQGENWVYGEEIKSGQYWNTTSLVSSKEKQISKGTCMFNLSVSSSDSTEKPLV